MLMSTSIAASKSNLKKVGRPRTTGPGEQVVVRLHEPLLSAIDGWCADQLDAPTRAEALRRLAAHSLSAESAAPAKPRRQPPKAGKSGS
jgi:hypothetical protein